jgi:hypothetical protein
MSHLRTRSLWTKLARLESHLSRHQHLGAPQLHALREDPARLLTAAGMAPDPWQERLLRAPVSRALLLCSRQAGKSTTAAALALRAALFQPAALVLVLSPSQRQSGELFRKVLDLFAALDRPVGVTAESALRLELANGSRVVALPGDERNIRCFSGVALLVIDEAARVADALYYAVRPMLAVSQGQLVALSTPFGKRGWFHDAWHGDGTWERVRITADQCLRIPPAFLAEERRALGERWFRQEYECSFEDTVAAVFAYADIQAALSNDVQPWFAEELRG